MRRPKVQGRLAFTLTSIFVFAGMERGDSIKARGGEGRKKGALNKMRERGPFRNPYATEHCEKVEKPPPNTAGSSGGQY